MSYFALKLTLMRIILIPLFILFYYLFPQGNGKWLVLGIYTIACITDYLDGWYARKYNEISKLGAFLDPVADKMMVTAVLVVVLHRHPQWWLMLCTLIIVGREIWISALREWMAGLHLREIVKVSQIGKWKTAIQMVALGFLIYHQDFIGLPIWRIGQVLLIVAAFLTVYSLIDYTRAAWDTFTGKENQY